MIIIAFILGIIFACFVIAICVRISGIVIVDEERGEVKVTFESSTKLVNAKFIVLKVVHGSIHDTRK